MFPVAHTFHPSILRAYDIRGIVGETLGCNDARALGRAFAHQVAAARNSSRIVVGRDGRLTSPALEEALVAGLREAGATVVQVGVGPTPMVHFADDRLAADASVMVTGSHNPPSHNGFKLSLAGNPFFGEAIQGLAVCTAVPPSATPGELVKELGIRSDYVDALRNVLGQRVRPLRVAWDAGNGATGAVLEDLTASLPGEHRVLNAVIDGRFPAHHPDPSKAENLVELVATVRAGNFDLGIAFDGDGDRLGVIDGTGAIVSPDHLLCVFAADVLARSPGAAILADVKTSETVFEYIRRLGGRARCGQTGHAHMRARVIAGDALFAGEMSGHLFFADEHPGYDDALYAAVRLLRTLGQGPALAERCAGLPRAFSTPELRIPCPDERKFSVVRDVESILKSQGIRPSTLDGVRVRMETGWWLLRASNTEAAVVVRCETYRKEDFGALCATVGALLANAGVNADRFLGS